MSLLIGKVDKEYEKCTELKKEDVLKIMEWAAMQPHFPKITEMQANLFLYSNFFSSEVAKQCMDLYFTVRTHTPEFFKQRIPANVNLNVLLYTTLPKPTPEGYQLCYAKLIDTNPNSFNVGLQIKCFDMLATLTLNKEGTMPGHVCIHDLSGLTFAHITNLNLLLVKKFFFYLQNCIPLRIKGLHFINAGSIMDKLLTLIKPFLRNDLLSLVHIHAQLDTVYKFIPRECFPSDYPGGEAPSFEELWKQQQIDESKRPGKPKDIGKIFGVEGTFKKLDID